MPKRPRRVPEVDALVRDRLRWLDREIEGREKDVAETEARLAQVRARLVEDRAEQARLHAFLPSEFEERAQLIDRLLAKEGLEFREGMTREEREALDVERQSLVLRLGANSWPIEDLRKSVLGEVDDES
jgi:hypothetical protein